MKESETILITGGLGQVGSSLVDRLSARYNILVLDNYSNNCSTGNFGGEVKVIRGDIRNFETLKKASLDIDHIIHTAAQIYVGRSIKNPVFDAENNIRGTLNLLEVARRSKNIHNIIYLSSAAVYGLPEHIPIDENHPLKPISPYGLSKLTAETYCLLYNNLYGMHNVCVRPFNIYSEKQKPDNPYSGVISKFLMRIANNEPPIIYGAGDQTRDFVHIDDLNAFIELVLARDRLSGDVFNIGTGIATSILNLAKLMLKISGKKEGGILYKAEKIGDIKYSCADISKAKSVGYSPKISLEQGIREICNKHFSNGAS